MARQGKLCRSHAPKRDGRGTTIHGLPVLWLQILQNPPLQNMSDDSFQLILFEVRDGSLPTIICRNREKRFPKGAAATNESMTIGYTAEAGKLFDKKVLWRHRINPRKKTPLHITSRASNTLRQGEHCGRIRDQLFADMRHRGAPTEHCGQAATQNGQRR